MLLKNATDLFQTADIAKPLFYLMITTQSEQDDISALLSIPDTVLYPMRYHKQFQASAQRIWMQDIESGLQSLRHGMQIPARNPSGCSFNFRPAPRALLPAIPGSSPASPS